MPDEQHTPGRHEPTLYFGGYHIPEKRRRPARHPADNMPPREKEREKRKEFQSKFDEQYTSTREWGFVTESCCTVLHLGSLAS